MGYIAAVAAMATIFLGMKLIQPVASPAAMGIYAAWVALLLAAWFALTILSLVSRSRQGPTYTSASASDSQDVAIPVKTANPLRAMQ